MDSGTRKIYAVEWFSCVMWILVWGSLAYIALTEKSITLGGAKGSVHTAHFEGGPAVAVGLAMLGMAAGGIGWLLRLSRYRRLLRFVLFLLWLAFALAYVLS
jgi:hypothetical protein